MHNHYYNYYRHLIDNISDSDLRLLDNAQWQSHADIDPDKAESPSTREALRAISRHKYHCEEAMYGVC